MGARGSCRIIVLAVVGLVFGLILLTACNRPSTVEEPTSNSWRDSSSPSTKGHKNTARGASSNSNHGFQFRTRHVPVLHEAVFENGGDAGLNSIFEIVGGGVAASDFDRDGLPDLFVSLGGSLDPARKQVCGKGIIVAWNRDRWSFQNRTASARPDTGKLYVHGILAADMNADGFEDIIAYGWPGVAILINQGDGTFQQTPSQSLGPSPRWATAAACADLNADSHLDLYFGSYVQWDFDNNPICPDRFGNDDICSPTAFEGRPNTVWVSDGSGNWHDGGSLFLHPRPGKSLGAVAGQFNNSAFPELYVANDLEQNFLFVRRGEQYTDTAMVAGVAVDDTGTPNGSMGIAVADFDHDLREDLFISNLEHEMMGLYLNRGNDFFEHASRAAGLNFAQNRAVGFGVLAQDWDADGDDDVLVVCGHVHKRPDHGTMEQLPLLLENDGKGRFQRVTDSIDSFFSTPRVARGAAAADLDGDGDPDFVATQLYGPPSLVENLCSRVATRLVVELVGTRSPRTPVGARAMLRVGQDQWVRQLIGGGSYLSQSENVLFFTCPNTARKGHPDVEIQVHWPSGTVSKHKIKTGQARITIVEPLRT